MPSHPTAGIFAEPATGGVIAAARNTGACRTNWQAA